MTGSSPLLRGLSLPSLYLSVNLHSPLFSVSFDFLFKMAAVARSIRPLASRMLSQRAPVAASCRVSPVAGFPRGSVRCFSQSPLCMIALPIDGLDGYDVELNIWD